MPKSESAASIRPSQMAAVAERRFGDAVALAETGSNARANGAQYLGGLVLDILLKAQLMRRFPSVARKRRHEVTENDRHIWSLIWRSHDLSDMLDQLPDLAASLKRRGDRAGQPLLRWLLEICGAWSIAIRYSTQTTTMNEATRMLEQIRQLKEVLK